MYAEQAADGAFGSFFFLVALVVFFLAGETTTFTLVVAAPGCITIGAGVWTTGCCWTGILVTLLTRTLSATKLSVGTALNIKVGFVGISSGIGWVMGSGR